MKRLVDFIVSFFALIFFSPLLLVVMFFVWINDFGNPFYIASRVGKDEKTFKMYKLRSMIVNADKSGVDSTSSNDMRITRIGKFIRKFKMDELSQLINVLLGDMSLVGPRPNVKRETDLYTKVEKKLLSVRPGITDVSSIVFSDEGDILANSKDPDIDYNQLIRPGKGYLGLFYIENQSFLLDLKLLFITLITIFNRNSAINQLLKVLKKYNASELIIKIAGRNEELVPSPPPGAKSIVKDRSGKVDE
ncbi:MAG: lipopolysaccharide/colanic/teichoic acid biosynthesis glycosyltransferase [Patiriisocius sp.]|jgi:lipopolysaccharide/colanic/teichoic acid biosynthesis glycosyltransferase